MPWVLPGNTGTARKMRPNTQLLRKGRAHNHQVRARTLCKQGQGAQSQSQQRRPFGRFGWWVQQDSNLPLIKSQAALEPELCTRGYTKPTSLERSATIRNGRSVPATSELSCSNASSD